MIDKIEPFSSAREQYMADAELSGPWPALYRLIEAYERLHKERDRALAEVEQLKAKLITEHDIAVDTDHELDRVRAEVERLAAINVGLVRDYNHMLLQEKMRSDERDAALAEVERLQAILGRIASYGVWELSAEDAYSMQKIAVGASSGTG